MRRKQVSPERLPQAASPIEYLTENGFSIVRPSEIDASVVNTPRACHFLVHREHEVAREITVGFVEDLITRLQLRRRMRLSETSLFWLVCAESILANYLWEKNEYPPGGRLVVNDLPPDELMLAIHWQDKD